MINSKSAPLYRHWSSVQAVRPIREKRYTSTLSWPRHEKGSASRPGRSLPLGKTQYPLYRRLGGPQGQFGQVRKISPPPGFDPLTVQPVTSRYTDWATRPTLNDCLKKSPCVWSSTTPWRCNLRLLHSTKKYLQQPQTRPAAGLVAKGKLWVCQE